MPNKFNLLNLSIFFVFITVFVSLFLFINLRQDRYDYFLYLYGESVYPASKALLKALSRDGEIVALPEIYLNDKRQESTLIELRPDLREIRILIGKQSVVFPVKYSDLEGRGPVSADLIHLLPKDLERPNAPLKIGEKTIYLLPDQFRVVPEFETVVHLFCVENGAPCRENSLILNGLERPLNSGCLKFTAIFKNNADVALAFKGGPVFTAQIPYKGKMFRFFEDTKGLLLASLTDVKNVDLDCYNKGKWIGSDVLSVDFDGVVLPPSYKNCDTIQASFNSSRPGAVFAVYSKSKTLTAPVDDPYYSGLAKVISNFPESAREVFITSYNSSFFKPLPLIFNGEILEKRFNAQRDAKLEKYRLVLIISSLVGLVLFARALFIRIKVVEGEEGELISLSLKKQRAIALAGIVLYIVFFVFLIYLLDHLA